MTFLWKIERYLLVGACATTNQRAFSCPGSTAFPFSMAAQGLPVIDSELLAFYGIGCNEDLKAYLLSREIESENDLLVLFS